jgi:hypothetical protein
MKFAEILFCVVIITIQSTNGGHQRAKQGLSSSDEYEGTTSTDKESEIDPKDVFYSLVNYCLGNDALTELNQWEADMKNTMIAIADSDQRSNIGIKELKKCEQRILAFQLKWVSFGYSLKADYEECRHIDRLVSNRIKWFHELRDEVASSGLVATANDLEAKIKSKTFEDLILDNELV